MRVVVLGHRGMLGHVVSRYLNENGLDVRTFAEQFSAARADRFVERINDHEPDWCINCIGRRATSNSSIATVYEANTDLPSYCVRRLDKQIRFLHASTDAVFVPEKPNRHVQELPDAIDVYGISKARAEEAVLSNGGYVIRCSIIGPEINSPRSLLEWFLQQPGPVVGFENHLWNGISTLEWARLALQVIETKRPEHLLQPGIWPPITKAQLLRVASEVWEHRVPIESAYAPDRVSRTLLPSYETPPLLQQLASLREWYYSADKQIKPE